MEQAAAAGRATHAGHIMLQIRVASWRGDMARLEELSSNIQLTDDVSAGLLMIYSAGLRGEMDLGDADRMLSGALPAFINQRFATLACQLACEFFMMGDRIDLAERWLKEAVDRVLVDMAWLDLCPLLEPLRQRAGLAKMRRELKGRAETFRGRSAHVAPHD